MGNVVAIIPARSGSKSVKDKNIRIMNGKPMLAYTIEQALASTKIDRVIVSTDSEMYQAIAEKYGAEVPFLRPSSISMDTSLDVEVFEHALKWLQEYENYDVDICVHLRPTHPIRETTDIDAMINMLRSHPQFDSVRSVSPAKQVPYKMWLFQDYATQEMVPLVTCDIPEAYNAPRQSLPKVYMQNACIDVVRAEVVLKQRSMTGQVIGGYKMEYDYDIDTEEEFLLAEQVQLLRQKKDQILKICCDIDGVIAAKTPGNDYSLATPMKHNIDIINALHRQGHRIVLFTARGYATGIDWKETTARQMKEWGVLYDELMFGKPDADIYIDDKLMNVSQLKDAIIRKDKEGF